MNEFNLDNIDLMEIGFEARHNRPLWQDILGVWRSDWEIDDEFEQIIVKQIEKIEQGKFLEAETSLSQLPPIAFQSLLFWSKSIDIREKKLRNIVLRLLVEKMQQLNYNDVVQYLISILQNSKNTNIKIIVLHLMAFLKSEKFIRPIKEVANEKEITLYAIIALLNLQTNHSWNEALNLAEKFLEEYNVLPAFQKTVLSILNRGIDAEKTEVIFKKFTETENKPMRILLKNHLQENLPWYLDKVKNEIKKGKFNRELLEVISKINNNDWIFEILDHIPSLFRAEVLARINTDKSLAKLIEYIKKCQNDIEIGYYIISLGHFQGELRSNAMEVIRSYSGSENPKIRVAALIALSYLGDEIAQKLYLQEIIETNNNYVIKLAQKFWRPILNLLVEAYQNGNAIIQDKIINIFKNMMLSFLTYNTIKTVYNYSVNDNLRLELLDILHGWVKKSSNWSFDINWIKEINSQNQQIKQKVYMILKDIQVKTRMGELKIERGNK